MVTTITPQSILAHKTVIVLDFQFSVLFHSLCVIFFASIYVSFDFISPATSVTLSIYSSIEQ